MALFYFNFLLLWNYEFYLFGALIFTCLELIYFYSSGTLIFSFAGILLIWNLDFDLFGALILTCLEP